MAFLGNYLDLERCPHCQIDKPTLEKRTACITANFLGEEKKWWGFYMCKRCGGITTASAVSENGFVIQHFPESTTIEDSIPGKANTYLKQAVSSLHAPSGAIMLSASAIDAMLKYKGLKEGRLYPRIEKAAKEHLITLEMAQWAHQVRLDANHERHADDLAELPTVDEARQTVEFALALAQFLFVLPDRVTRGLSDTNKTEQTT